jgi:hypothetical protein
MHHEMRHIKQHYFELNYDPKTFLHFKEALKTAKENHLGEKAAEEVFDSCIEDIQSVFNLKSISRDNIPPKLREYAKKCLDGQQNYVPLDVNYDLYYNNFVEVDARFAGESMAKLFGLMDK